MYTYYTRYLNKSKKGIKMKQFNPSGTKQNNLISHKSTTC